MYLVHPREDIDTNSGGKWMDGRVLYLQEGVRGGDEVEPGGRVGGPEGGGFHGVHHPRDLLAQGFALLVQRLLVFKNTFVIIIILSGFFSYMRVIWLCLKVSIP